MEHNFALEVSFSPSGLLYWRTMSVAVMDSIDDQEGKRGSRA